MRKNEKVNKLLEMTREFEELIGLLRTRLRTLEDNYKLFMNTAGELVDLVKEINKLVVSESDRDKFLRAYGDVVSALRLIRDGKPISIFKKLFYFILGYYAEGVIASLTDIFGDKSPETDRIVKSKEYSELMQRVERLFRWKERAGNVNVGSSHLVPDYILKSLKSYEAKICEIENKTV